MEKNCKKDYLTDHNLLIVQDLYQGHYQIQSIIFLKKLLDLDLNLDMMIKNVKKVEFNLSIATVFLNTQILNMI